MQWFRMYSEARNDRKLDSLSDVEFRIWFNLMCMAGESGHQRGVIEYANDDLLAIEVSGGNVESLDRVIAKLERLAVITWVKPDDGDLCGIITFINWQKRQYDKPSDAPESTRERKRRSRDSSKSGVTPIPVTPKSRDVTPSHATYTDTENTQIQNRAEESRPPLSPSEGEVSKPQNLRVIKTPVPVDIAYKIPKDVWSGMMTEQCMEQGVIEYETAKMVDHFTANGERKVDWVAAWRNWMRSPYRKPIPIANSRASPNGRVGYTHAELIALGKEEPGE